MFLYFILAFLHGMDSSLFIKQWKKIPRNKVDISS